LLYFTSYLLPNNLTIASYTVHDREVYQRILAAFRAGNIREKKESLLRILVVFPDWTVNIRKRKELSKEVM